MIDEQKRLKYKMGETGWKYQKDMSNHANIFFMIYFNVHVQLNQTYKTDVNLESSSHLQKQKEKTK